MLFPQEIAKPGEPVIGLKTLWDHVTHSAAFLLDVNNTEHDHGIPVDHYIACSNVTDLNVVVEYEVCLSQKNFTLPDTGIKDQVPTRIELKVYSNNYYSFVISFVFKLLSFSFFRFVLRRNKRNKRHNVA